ncbi:PulJ/GspJ family protein [Pedobacter rhizosphaerae]|uniref:Prepilin-type N-terminal cleavage/methylation domain-containing protein n=1 Tax=Pedobacter rhizosphaerae TaxID=390241 RepID=A0A1H9VF44_9SPHI|nr:hypothetical protein [Pedobacter rhizosphaerae]SES20198.1 hypothetical protein SAMN04488023_14215 [Pedobacter rhizosphaerae]
MKKKIPASTVIEVLIAMVIILVVFAIAMGLFSNVLSSGVSYRKVQAQNQLQVLSQEVINKGYVENTAVVVDSIDYQLSTETTENPSLSSLKIKASQHGKLLGEVKCLFKTKEGTNEN